jgi:hypothetical protein
VTIAALVATTGPINGLTDEEKYAFNECWKVWTQKLRRNMLRNQYYDQHNVLKDLEIAIPPHLTDLELVLGWPAKAVDTLARRCRLDGFVVPGVEDDPFGIRDMWRSNEMDIELPQTLTSALVHSCAFLTVTKGDPGMGEPEVLISTQSALFAAGVWDSRRRRLKYAMTITDMDEIGRVSGWALFMPGVTVTAYFDGRWRLSRFEHTLDRLPVEVLPYKPALDKPFGCSRISRAVMGLADSALRTLFRMEVHAEFFSSPQRYAMGADESMFVDEDGNPLNQWQAILGRVWAAGRDPDTGDMPQLGQFAQSSPQPHTDQLRSLGAQFCAETSIPMHTLGIAPESNPSSAEALEIVERDLVDDAEAAMDVFGSRICRAMKTAVQIRDNLDSPPEELAGLDAKWRDPRQPLRSSAGDFIIKLMQAMPWLAESRVPLEQLGWDETTVERAWADKRKANVTSLLQRLPSAGQTDQVSGGGFGS